MSTLNLEQFSTHLQQLNFNLLFTDVLGWNHPPTSERVWQDDEAKDIRYRRRMVAELSGVAVLEIITETGWPDETQRMAIEADSSISAEALAKALTEEDFINAGAKGMEAARAIGMLSYRSYEGYNIAQSDDRDALDSFKVQSYQRYQAFKLRKRFNALSYISVSKTMDSHNVGRGRGGISTALSTIRANTLVVGIRTDILFPFEEQAQITAHIPHAQLKLIDSKFGHDGFLIEFDQMLRLLERFMKRKVVKSVNLLV